MVAVASDERGVLTFGQVQRRSNALARSMAAVGIGAGDGVAIMCRDHRWFVESTLACSKLGATALFLNTAFAGPQLTEVVDREGPVALIYDQAPFGRTPDGTGRASSPGTTTIGPLTQRSRS